MKKKTNTKPRDTWVGFFPRRTKTKKEKVQSAERKHKNRSWEY